LQNEVTIRIADALHLELVAAEVARCTGHCDVVDYVFRGRSVYLKPVTADTHAERHRLEGSVRCSISLIRVNTQLIDAETDAHLWADWFDSR
jgi:TolB-like protein